MTSDKLSGKQNHAYEMDQLDELKSTHNANQKTDTLESSTGSMQKLQAIVKASVKYVIHLAAIAYFCYATYYYIQLQNNDCVTNYGQGALCGMHFCTGYGMLLILFILTYIGLLYYLIIKPKFGAYLHKNYLKPFNTWWLSFSHTSTVSALMIVAALALLAVYLYFQTQHQRHRLKGLIAPVLFLVLGYVFSTKRSAINWRSVITAIALQFLLGIFCVQWDVGRGIFACLGDKMTTLLNYSKDGAIFVYGKQLVGDSVFAFSVLPALFFITMLVSILYYLGIMQRVLIRGGWVLSEILGSTVCVSVIVVANIVLSMSESPLVIKPYLKVLTRSEIHAIMVSGFATVSGSVMAGYLSFGASAANIITSCVMAAPATIAFSLLYMPETEESKTTKNNIQLEKSEDTSVLNAAANGANNAISIVLGIAANIVAFMSFVAFLNGIVSWLGFLVGLPDIDFEWIFSKLFIPIAWAMGAPWKECEYIAQVIAKKSIINEFVAYERLGQFYHSNLIGSRSMTITTFAICGFANPSSLGISLGVLCMLAPTRRKDIAAVAFRAYVVGNIVCFVSASFAGILTSDIDESTYNTTMLINNATLTF